MSDIVMERTGVRLADIPRGEPADMIGGTIICRIPGGVIVSHGYPDREEDGVPIWDARPENFRLIEGS